MPTDRQALDAQAGPLAVSICPLVMIRYAECPTRPMRTLPAGCGCDETACDYSRIRDGFEIQCALKPTENSDEAKNVPPTICETERDKKNKLPKCPLCPADPWVVLATVTLASATTGGGTAVSADSIDNSTRSIVYSSAALQDQLIASCCE